MTTRDNVQCTAIVVVVCRSDSPFIYRRTPSSHKTGLVASGHAHLLFTTTSMLTQCQQGGRGLFGWWGKRGCPYKNHRKLVRNRHNRVDMTKHKCRDIGVPDVMGVPNRQAVQRGMGQRELTFQVHCIIASQTDI